MELAILGFGVASSICLLFANERYHDHKEQLEQVEQIKMRLPEFQSQLLEAHARIVNKRNQKDHFLDSDKQEDNVNETGENHGYQMHDFADIDARGALTNRHADTYLDAIDTNHTLSSMRYSMKNGGGDRESTMTSAMDKSQTRMQTAYDFDDDNMNKRSRNDDAESQSKTEEEDHSIHLALQSIVGKGTTTSGGWLYS